MAIGTSDGRVFEDEWNHALSSIDDMHDALPKPVILDKTGTGSGDLPIKYAYDDSPTPQQNARDEAVRNNTLITGRVIDPSEFEDRMPEYNDSLPEQTTMGKEGWAYSTGQFPPAIRQDISHYPQATLDLSSIPKSGTPEEKALMDKPMNEEFKDQSEKEGAWRMMMRHVFNEPEIAAQDFKKGVGMWAQKTAETVVNAFKAPGDAAQGNLTSDEEGKRAFDLAAIVIGGPAPLAAKAIDGTLGSIAGVSAKTADRGALDLARTLDYKGWTPTEVWDKTGWYKGLDNKWKFEIDTKNAKLTDAFQEFKDHPTILSNPDYFAKSTLEHVLDFPELYKAYPELKNVEVHVDNSLESIGLAVKRQGENPYISINPRKLDTDEKINSALNVLLHEVQHHIQSKEKFYPGATDTSRLQPVTDFLSDRYWDAATTPEKAAQLLDTRMSFLRNDKTSMGKTLGRILYDRSPGEAEARIVMKRRNWTPEERRREAPDASIARGVEEGWEAMPLPVPGEIRK